MSTQPARREVLVGRSYTRSRRFPRMFGRMPGRDGGYVPGGPYTLTQGALFLLLLLIVWKLPLFDWLGPARWFLPLAAVFLRRARIESRTPLGWLAGLVSHLSAPSSGLVDGKPYRPGTPAWLHTRLHLHEAAGPERAVSSLQRLLEHP
ncbi:hypothetical protein ACPZ19_18740 [Amycolatopsis lurida]